MPSTTPPTFTIVSSRALILYKQLVATWDDEFERIVKNASFSQVFPDGSVMFEGLSLQQELFQLGLRHNVASRPELSITAASYRSLSCWPSSYYDLLYPASYNGHVLAAHDAFTVCPGIFLKQESPDQQQLDDFPITFEFRSSPSKAIQDGIQTRFKNKVRRSDILALYKAAPFLLTPARYVFGSDSVRSEQTFRMHKCPCLLGLFCLA